MRVNNHRYEDCLRGNQKIPQQNLNEKFNSILASYLKHKEKDLEVTDIDCQLFILELWSQGQLSVLKDLHEQKIELDIYIYDSSESHALFTLKSIIESKNLEILQFAYSIGIDSIINGVIMMNLDENTDSNFIHTLFELYPSLSNKTTYYYNYYDFVHKPSLIKEYWTYFQDIECTKYKDISNLQALLNNIRNQKVEICDFVLKFIKCHYTALIPEDQQKIDLSNLTNEQQTFAIT